MKVMRAKMRITSITVHNPEYEELLFYPVSKDGPYPSDGSDEDNSYAKYSPSGELKLCIANPALIGKFKVGDTFYLDFTPVPA